MVETLRLATAMPTITAIVPTYNRARYLGRAIESLLNQTMTAMQVIVVDDGSVDATVDVLEAFGDRIQMIRKANGGKASALNFGLSFAVGELIWIFDDDDVALPDALERLATALVEHPEYGFSYGSYDHLIEGKDGTERVIQPDLRIDAQLDFKTSVLERCYIFQPALLVRRACYDAVGPFDESLVRSQDYEMLIRLSRQYEGINLNRILFHQRQHSGLRGSAASSFPSEQIAAAWMRYERVIFSRVYNSYPLSAYLGGSISSGRSLSLYDERAALLERCCIMARKGMWDFAAADVNAICQQMRVLPEHGFTSSESATLRRLFGPYSYADHKLAESEVFFASLNAHMPRTLRRQAKRLLFSPLLHELVYSFRKRHIRYFLGTAMKCLVFLWQAYAPFVVRTKALKSKSGIRY